MAWDLGVTSLKRKTALIPGDRSPSKIRSIGLNRSMQLNLRADASSGTAIRTACLAGPRCAMCSSKSQMTFAENIALKYHINMEQKPDISSSGAAKSEADPAYVNLKVREQEHDSVTHFRMKRVTQLKKVPSSLAHS